MRINKEIKIKDIAGERIALRQGSYGADMTNIIAFNPTAEWLWNKLANKDFSDTDIKTLLQEAFDLDEQTAARDAKKWIDQCFKADIIKA